MATLIGTTTSSTPHRWENTPHIFKMADGNFVAIYFDGTNSGYRIKSGGSWGSFTAFSGANANPTYHNGSSCRNGDTIFYGRSSTTGSQNVFSKLAYSGGAITETHVLQSTTGSSNNVVTGAYYDTTNSYVHFRSYHFDGVNEYMYHTALNTSLTQQYSTNESGSAFSASNGNICAVAGDGSSTFYSYNRHGTSSTTIVGRKLVAGASSYTVTNQSGLPTAGSSIASIAAVYDSAGLVLFLVETTGANVRYTTRTNDTTYTSLTTIVSSGVTTTPTLAVGRITGSDSLVVLYTRTTTQANGEIYMVRRTGGSWEASPGTRVAGGASTGWDMSTIALTDLNNTNKLLATYKTGTGSPWSIYEDLAQLAQPAGGFFAFL